MFTTAQFRKISSAGLFARRKNPIVQRIDDYLDRFPRASNDTERLLLATTVMQECRNFLQSKPVSRRREGVIKLLWEASDEAVRLTSVIRSARAVNNWNKFKTLLNTPGKAKGHTKLLDDAVWLEAVDKHHRAGNLLRAPHQVWAASSTNQPFFDWLDSVYLPQQRLDAQVQLMNSSEVVYLDTEEKRREFEVAVDAQSRTKFRHVDNGEPFSTTNLETVFSGKGAGIYVLSGDDKIYSNSHKKGEFHHSSFLGGKPVACAGEWIVDDRGLVMISPKTGHYLCGEAEFRHVLFFLHRRGIDLRSAAALWPWPTFQTKHFYNAYDLLRADDLIANTAPMEGGARLPEIPAPSTQNPNANSNYNNSNSNYNNMN
jgi:hypothetical protein